MYRAIIIAIAAALILSLSWSLFRKRSPAEKLTAVQKEFGPKGGIVFQTELQGKPTAFLLMDCAVYLLDTTAKKVKRSKVVKTGFYLGFTTCTGQSIRAEGDFVIAHLENRAIGAGGGNTSGGAYRSRDGLNWEKNTKKGWLPVADAQS